MDTDSHRQPDATPWCRLCQRPGAVFLATLLFALLMVAAQRGLALWRSASTPMPGAYWIWAPEQGKDPVAFYAVRDVEISTSQASHAKARLAIVADESYVVYLNGLYLGSNTYRHGAPIDTYDVSGKLRSGRNRVVVELRSQRGIGGLLADLRVTDDEPLDAVGPLLVSDGAWQIFRRYDDALFDLEQPLSGGEPAEVWQLSPTGRWRPAESFAPRPLLDTDQRPQRQAPQRMRGAHGDRWIDLRRPRLHWPEVGPEVLLDWGHTVEGFLYLDLVSPDTPPALIYFGNEPPDIEQRPPDHVMIPMPGIDQWRDLHARRFRYVLLVGVAPKSRVEVRRVDPSLAAHLGPPPPAQGGVFGLRPALRHTSVEEMVWQRLRDEALAQR